MIRRDSWIAITSKITFDELATHSGSRVSCWRPRTSCSPHGPLENKCHQTVWKSFHNNCQHLRPGAQLVTASLNVWQVVTSAGNVFWLLAIPQRNFRARRLEYLRITFFLLFLCLLNRRRCPPCKHWEGIQAPYLIWREDCGGEEEDCQLFLKMRVWVAVNSKHDWCFLRLATSLADVNDKSLRAGALKQDIKTI